MGFLVANFPSPLFAQAPCLFYPAVKQKSVKHMQTCPSAGLASGHRGPGPLATRPNSAGIILTRDQSSSHTSKSTRQPQRVVRGRGGQGPSVLSALILKLTAAMSPVLVGLLLIQLLRRDSGSVHLFLTAQIQPGCPQGLWGPLSFLSHEDCCLFDQWVRQPRQLAGK